MKAWPTQSVLQTFQLIKSDMQFRCDYESKQLTFIRVLSFLLNHAVLSQILYRFQIFFFTHHLGLIASFFEGINSMFFTVRIDSRTQIGEGLLLLHANYINIGKNVILGKRCILAHQNSIGPAFTIESVDGGSDIGPLVGDYVLFGAGSVVCGNIKIGSYSKISINSAVDKSFPDHAILFGVPARNTNKTISENNNIVINIADSIAAAPVAKPL